MLSSRFDITCDLDHGLRIDYDPAELEREAQPLAELADRPR